jgi:hypothetical protein
VLARVDDVGATPDHGNRASASLERATMRGTVDADIQKLCIYTLGRINTADPAKSVLITQAAPVSDGGTSNHPYKLDTPAKDLPGFKAAVMTWAMGEK